MILENDQYLERLFETQGNKKKLEKFKGTYNLDSRLVKEFFEFFTKKHIRNINDFKVAFTKEFREYTFYFKIGIRHKLEDIDSMTVRSNQLISLSNLSSDIKKFLERIIEEEKSKGRTTLIILDEQRIADYWILQICNIAKSIEDATDYAHNELIKSLGVLNLLNTKYVFTYYKKYSSSYLAMQGTKIEPMFGIVNYEEDFFITDSLQQQLSKITNICRKVTKSDIDKRILKTFDLYSQIQISTEPISKIVIYMTILENLLIHQTDRDYLGWKLGDRISFLIGNKNQFIEKSKLSEFDRKFEGKESSNKYVINELVKDLYDIRSKLVHSSESMPEIEMYDIELIIAYSIVKEVISEFLELEDKGITNLHGENGLLDHLDNLKYNLNKTAF